MSHGAPNALCLVLIASTVVKCRLLRSVGEGLELPQGLQVSHRGLMLKPVTRPMLGWTSRDIHRQVLLDRELATVSAVIYYTVVFCMQYQRRTCTGYCRRCTVKRNLVFIERVFSQPEEQSLKTTADTYTVPPYMFGTAV